jgi:hypothetical protein
VTTYLYDAPAFESRQSRRGEAVGLAIDQTELDAGAAARERRRRPVDARLRAGDTLVVSGVGCLGQNYAEIFDAIHDLMRRRICVRSINDNLTFDGGVVDAGMQASRDSLIAFAAAAAEAEKIAKRAAKERQNLVEELSAAEPTGRYRRAPLLQFGVVAAQLVALAAAAYLLSVVSPKFGRHSPVPEPPRIAELDRPRVEQPIPPPANFREIPEERHAAASPKTEQAPVPQTGAPQFAGDQESSAGAEQSLGLSPGREREVFSTVGDWRSARVNHASFPVAAGALVPRAVHLAIFPRGLVAREARLRGYRFIVVGQRIAVVDPATRRIVAILNGLKSDEG